jgi:hypothetical protein
MSKPRTRRIGLSVALAALFVAALAASPVAAGSQVKVTGLLTPDTAGVCTADPVNFGAYTVDGTLTGCWYIKEWNIQNETPSGSVRASGTERFIGCLGSRCGEFWTNYTYTYRYVDGVLVHGRCHHPIDSSKGVGAFAGVGGVLQMHDLPNGCSTYTGHLSF